MKRRVFVGLAIVIAGVVFALTRQGQEQISKFRDLVSCNNSMFFISERFNVNNETPGMSMIGRINKISEIHEVTSPNQSSVHSAEFDITSNLACFNDEVIFAGRNAEDMDVIYALNSNTQETRQVYSAGSDKVYIAEIQAGSEIAFYIVSQGVWIYSSASELPVPLSPEGAQYIGGFAFFNSTQWAYVNYNTSSTWSVVINIDSAEPIVLEEDSERPIWCNDNTLIYQSQNLSSYTMSNATAQELTQDQFHVFGKVNCSPDGQQIAFMATEITERPVSGEIKTAGNAVFVINTDGSELRKISEGGSEEAPVWNAAGTQLTFITNESDGSIIETVDLD